MRQLNWGLIVEKWWLTFDRIGEMIGRLWVTPATVGVAKSAYV